MLHVMRLVRPAILTLLFPILLILSGGTAFAQAAGGAARATVTVIDARSLEVDCVFPPLDRRTLRPIEGGADGMHVVSIPGTNLIGYSLEVTADVAEVSVISVDVEDLALDASAPVFTTSGDAPLTGDSAADRAAAATLKSMRAAGEFPAAWAESTPAGALHSVKLSTLRLNPWRVDVARGVVRAARSMRLRVTLRTPVPGSTLAQLTDVLRGGSASSKRGSPGLASSSTRADRVAPDGYEYKIFTDRDAIYRLTSRDLLDAGVPLDQIDARTLRLIRDGIEQPIYVFDRGDGRLQDNPREQEYIEFFGQRQRASEVEAGSDLYFDPYTRHSVYFLTWGGLNGKRLVEESGAIRTGLGDPQGDITDRSQAFRSTVHLEQDEFTVSLGDAELNTRSDRYDRRMWVAAGQNSLASVSATIPAPQGLFTDTVRVRAAVRGTLVTGSADGLEYRTTTGATLYVGGFRTLSARARSVGLTHLSSDSNATFTLTADRLAGPEQVTITIANETSSDPRIRSDLNLNWVELTYPRTYTAVNDSIDFSPPPGLGARYYTFRVFGFTSDQIRLYRTGVSRIINTTVRTEPAMPGDTSARPARFDLLFQAYAASESERFYATTEENILRPIILRDDASDLRIPSNDGSYVVIVNDGSPEMQRLGDPSHPLRRLKDLKERGGAHRVMIVRVSDVYDEFAGGSVSPLAIKRFISHAYESWATAPRYVLLVGEGSAPSARDLPAVSAELYPIVAERAYIPSIMMQTVLYGATECDYLYGCVAGTAMIQNSPYEGGRSGITDDLVAEVTVGRIPTRSYQELDAYVGKLVEQETDPDRGAWRGRTLFVGGWDGQQTEQIQEAVRRTFRASSEPVRMLASDAYAASRYALARRSLSGTMAEGVGLVTYLGHGGGAQWEASADLSIANAFQVQNRRRMAPVLSLTCFTGAYSSERGLVGRLVASPNGGALVALATPGYGWLQNNGYLAESIFSVMHDARFRDLSFGEIITLAKARYLGSYQSRFPDHAPTVAAMYTVFGDPSLRMPFPADSFELASSIDAVTPGQTIGAGGQFRFTPVAVTATLFDTTETAIEGATVTTSLSGGVVSLTATVPAGYAQDYVGLRVFGWDNTGRGASGAIRFPLVGGVVGDVRPIGVLRPGADARFEVLLRGAGAAPDSLRVSLRYAAPVLNRAGFALRATGGGRFESDPVPAGLVLPGGVFEVELPGVREVTGNGLFTFYVEGGADPAAHPSSALDSTHSMHATRSRLVAGSYQNPTIGMRTGTGGARFGGTIYNWGDRDAAGVGYRFIYDSAGTSVVLGSGSVDVPARDSVVIMHDAGWQVPVQRLVRLQLQVDSLDPWADADLRNNEAYEVTSISGAGFVAGIGFTRDGATPAAWILPPLGSVTLDPSEARVTGLAVARLDSVLPPTQQPWRFVPFAAPPTIPSAALALRSDQPQQQATLELVLDTAAVGGRPYAIVRYDATTRLWTAVPTTRTGADRISASVPLGGTYAAALAEDLDPPMIRFSVEGQFFVDSSSVARDARFAAILTDPSGINTSSIEATLDGRALEFGREVVWLDSTITASSANLRAQPALSPGAHTLCVRAADRFGNVRTECTRFEISDKLEVLLYGNYPNPFSSETFIAYELRGASMVDEVELKIFSTAGRLVRTFRWPSNEVGETVGMLKGGTGQPNAVGYHEVWWDGTDNRGESVANGVYFYRVRLVTADETVEGTGTIARVR